MIKFNASKDIEISDFFENYVPEIFEQSTSGMDQKKLKGKDFKLQFNVNGTKYGVEIVDGREVKIHKGGVDGANLVLETSEKDWRENVTGEVEGVIERFIDPAELTVAGRYEKVQTMKGTLNLTLTRDEEPMKAVIVFNGANEPITNMTLKMTDWVGMMKGEQNGQMLFMQGAMQVDGDMMLLMSLQALM